MPVRMRGPGGETVDVDEERVGYLATQGFAPLSTAQESREAVAEAAKPDDRGVLGSLSAGATGFLSGLTLGGSDIAIGALATPNELEQVREDRATNPTISTGANIAGGLAASFALPGSALARTPAGFLAQTANRGVEAARALGGARGFIGQAAVTGAEAAAQSAGSYLGSVALGERKLSAEGIGGALGAGFAFGAAGGAAVYGVERGSIAARRMFSSVMEGGEDATLKAAGEWERRSTELFDANRTTIDEAKRRLDDAMAASRAAGIEAQRAGARVADERVLARIVAGDDAARRAAAAAEDADRLAAMETRIGTGQVPGEAGPFTPAGVRSAAERELRRESARATIGGYDPFSLTTGRALDDVSGGPGPTRIAGRPPGPEADALGAAARAVDDVTSAGVAAKPARYAESTDTRPATFAADEFEGYKDAYVAATSDQHAAAGMMYSGGEYRSINAALRASKPLTGDVAKAVQYLDESLDLPQARLPRDVTLYRGLSGKDARNRFANLKPGEVFEDQAYVSTAGGAGSKVRNEEVVFNIHAPAGTRAAPIPSKYSSEQEILLGRNTRFRVESNELVPQVPTAYRHQDAIDYEVLPDKSVRVTTEYTPIGSKLSRRITDTFKPIREINVTILDDTPLDPVAQRLADKVAEAEGAESALMRALQGTKQQIDEGATIGQVGAGAQAQPLSPKQLTDEYDRLMQAAAESTDIEARQALLRQAGVLEDQIATLPPSVRALSEVDSVTQAMSRYERAMADLADDLGDGAHPMSRALADEVRQAETEAERKMIDRAAQAIDDQVDGIGRVTEEGVKAGTQQGGGEVMGPKPLAPKERIRYAKDRKLEADAARQTARVAEAEARAGLQAARSQGDATARAVGTVGLPKPPAAPAGRGGLMADFGTALELAGMVGIPGLPRPSDLPIIGPIVGLWLKGRALKAGADRLMGRVPATGNARAAVLAAQTKDRAARAVDRMLGHVERGAPKLRTAVAVAGPRLLEAIQERVYDDGGEQPAKGAGLQEHAAARAREISALAANPALIARQVRRELREVADPDLVAAAVEFRARQVSYLDSVAPKEPPPSPFRKTPWKPDKLAAAGFARRYAVAMNPVQALEQIEQRSLTPEAAEAYRAVYPLLYEQTRARLIAQSTELQTTLPRSQLTRMSILFELPLDSALEPATLSRFQGVYAATSPADPAPQQTPPAPSIAGSTNLTSLFQTVSDRRAAAR